MFYEKHDPEELEKSIRGIINDKGFIRQRKELTENEQTIFDLILNEIVPLFCSYKKSFPYLKNLNEKLKPVVEDLPNIPCVYVKIETSQLSWPLPLIDEEFQHPKKNRALPRMIIEKFQEYGFNTETELFPKYFPLFKTVGLVSANLLEPLLKKHKMMFAETKAILPGLIHGDSHLYQIFIMIGFFEENFSRLKEKYSLEAKNIAELLTEVFFLLLHDQFRSIGTGTTLWNVILDRVCFTYGDGYRYDKNYKKIEEPKKWGQNGPHSPYALNVTLLSPEHPYENLRKYLLLAWAKQLEKIQSFKNAECKSIEEAFFYCVDTPLIGKTDNVISKITPIEFYSRKRLEKEALLIEQDNDGNSSPNSYVILKKNP